jgi:hypothetical protein
MLNRIVVGSAKHAAELGQSLALITSHAVV